MAIIVSEMEVPIELLQRVASDCVRRVAHGTASVAGCFLTFQTHMPRMEPTAYVLHTVLSRRGSPLALAL
jgi:hypothetical protein